MGNRPSGPGIGLPHPSMPTGSSVSVMQPRRPCSHLQAKGAEWAFHTRQTLLSAVELQKANLEAWVGGQRDQAVDMASDYG